VARALSLRSSKKEMPRANKKKDEQEKREQ
jgi:hypothetical protein